MKIADLNKSMKENFIKGFPEKGAEVIKKAQECIEKPGASYLEIKNCIEETVKLFTKIDDQKKALEILIPFIVVG